jgi:uncharacterized protein
MYSTELRLTNLLATAEEFLNKLISEIHPLVSEINSLECDHLCLRTATNEEYRHFKNELSDYGKLITEAVVNGRPISTFKLNTPVNTSHHIVGVIELASPSTTSRYETGFEHAEFIVRETLGTFISKYPHCHFVKKGDQDFNRQLRLTINEKMQAKFHHTTLERIIEIEEAEIQDVIFDLDGTLIKSREHIYEINRIVFSQALGREVSLQECTENFFPEFPKLFEVFGVTSPKKQLEAVLNWGNVSGQFHYELYDNALETLNVLRENNFRLHLWTARDEFSSRKILKDHNIEDFFSTLSFATENLSKPHPDSLDSNLKNLHRNQAIVIGDSSTDIFGARNIGAIRAAALWDPHSKEDALIQAGADLLFYSMNDFKNWLRKTSKRLD